MKKSIKAFAVINEYGIVGSYKNAEGLAVYAHKAYAQINEKPFKWEQIVPITITILLPSRKGNKKSK